jgi:CheY-like chemotaxis protein
VLIVDDDLHFARLVTRMLQSSQQQSRYNILSAHSGREALAVLERTRPDIVLLDLKMPELSGHDVLAAMRGTPGLDDIPVIVVSAGDRLEEQVVLTGKLSVVRPDGFHFEELLTAVEALLSALEPSRQYLSTPDKASEKAGTGS